MESNERTVFNARAAAAAEAAQRAGVTLRKSRTAFELIAETADCRVSFPIVTDDRDWRQTTAQEAFYGLLLDAHEWALARFDDSALPENRSSDVSPLHREEAGAMQRLAALSTLLGGDDKLADALNAVGLSPVPSTN